MKINGSIASGWRKDWRAREKRVCKADGRSEAGEGFWGIVQYADEKQVFSEEYQRFIDF